MIAISVKDFILRDEQNLRVAAAVAEAWTEIRNGIINDFLDRLAAKLVAAKPGWETSIWKQFFDHGYATFNFYPEQWSGEYWITLQAERHGEKMLFGVQRNNNDKLVAERPLSVEVLDAVKPHFPSVKSSGWWDAQVPMQNPAADWRTPDILWRIRSDSSYLDSVAEQMLTVAKVTESIIGRLTMKK